MNRTNAWYQRVYFPESSAAALGSGYEYWILEPTRYEGHAELKAISEGLGRRWTKRRLAAELTENLLTDVIAAAGGVEHSLDALRGTMAAAQYWCDEHLPDFDPDVPHGIANEDVVNAWYAFSNMLSWARALDERLDRRSFQRGLTSRQGLLPAIKPVRLRRRVEKLVDELRAGPVGETRRLANFTLHAALIRSPQSGARLDRNTKVRLPIPDNSNNSVYHWKMLTWNDNRDGMEFADALWCSIESFMDGLIQAFERAVPK